MISRRRIKLMENNINDLFKEALSILENNDSGAKVLVDPQSEMILFGTTIDFVTEDFSKGIFENKFIFKPDNELVSACGCGVSFSLK